MRLKIAHGRQGFRLDFPGDTPVTVGRALASLGEEHPEVYGRWCNREGRLPPSLNIFVNGEHIRYRKGLDTPLFDGDEVYVIPILAGG